MNKLKQNAKKNADAQSKLKKVDGEMASKFKSQKINKSIDLSSHKVNISDIKYDVKIITKTDGSKLITRGTFKNDLVLDVDESIFFDNEKLDHTNKSISKFMKNFGEFDMNSV